MWKLRNPLIGRFSLTTNASLSVVWIASCLSAPFDSFSEIHFWPTDPKIFLKAPIYTNYEGERAPQKTRFFCQNFSKIAQKRLFWLFFQKFACGAENLAKVGAKQCFGRARKNNLVDLRKKKGRQNFGKFFENPSPPRENPRSAPDYNYIYIISLMKRTYGWTGSLVFPLW